MEILNKYGNTVKVFARTFEQEAYDQVKRLADCEAYKHSKIRVMPDAHAGKGCVVGTTIQLAGKVTPNLVGVDIGCGMLVVEMKEREINLEKLDCFIRENIPCGFNVRETPLEKYMNDNLGRFHCQSCLDEDLYYKSIGTLGGGNHFIEIDKSAKGNLYLVIHSGSRNLGVRVCRYYQDMAIAEMGKEHSHLHRNALIEKLKAEGRQSEIQSEMKKLPHHAPADKELAYLSGDNYLRYIHDMREAQDYARNNRLAMAEAIFNGMRLHFASYFETIHNYISTFDLILRKGAVSARKGEKLIIPMNMRDGALLCVGKGNPDWNYSAPHGAGRLMSRTQAKERVSMEEYKESMNGVYSTSVNRSTIDEAPQAYKPMSEIISLIGDTVEVKEIIKPIYNFKASDIC